MTSNMKMELFETAKNLKLESLKRLQLVIFSYFRWNYDLQNSLLLIEKKFLEKKSYEIHKTIEAFKIIEKSWNVWGISCASQTTNRQMRFYLTNGLIYFIG